MKIGLFTDTLLPVVDGVGRVVLAYAETLPQMNHQVIVSAPMTNAGYRGGFPYELIDYVSFKVPSAPQYKTGSPIMDANYIKRLAFAELDIAHAHSPFTAGTEAMRVARERHIPLVATFHSKYYDDFLKLTKSESLSKLLLKRVVRFYNRCDDVWAVSESTADVLRGYGYEGHITVMPNGVNRRVLNPDALKAVNEQFAIGDLPVFLFVGQMNWKKNILRVLEAAALLKQHGAHFKLLLAGQGPDEKQIKEKIGGLSLDDTALCVGHVTNTEFLDGLYARASALTFPSLYDNAPMVVREAAVMGTPAILTIGSSAAEIVQNLDNGYLCEDQSEALYHVLLNIIENRENAKKIGLKAQQTIPLPWKKVMHQAVFSYESVIRNYQSSLVQ